MKSATISKEICKRQPDETYAVLRVGEACDEFANTIEAIQDIISKYNFTSQNSVLALDKIAELISEYKIGRHLYVSNIGLEG